jgi:periplasmic protein TonB
MNSASMHVFTILFLCLLIGCSAHRTADASSSYGGIPEPTVAPGSADQNGIYRVGGKVTAPKVQHQVEPIFSMEARRKKIQGVVLMEAVITPQGVIQDVRVLKSPGHGLDEEAIKAVRQWTFAPATKDGQPVPVRVRIEVAFNLYKQ